MAMVKKEDAAAMAMAGFTQRLDMEIPLKYQVGDKIRSKNINPTGHTRLPRYARGKVGTVEIHHGVFVTPDTNAHGKGEHPQNLYCVAFNAQELWGPEASDKDKVYVDLWEDYIEGKA